MPSFFQGMRITDQEKKWFHLSHKTLTIRVKSILPFSVDTSRTNLQLGFDFLQDKVGS